MECKLTIEIPKMYIVLGCSLQNVVRRKTFKWVEEVEEFVLTI